MRQPNNARAGACVGIGAAIGTNLGTLTALITGNWVWMPVTLSACIATGALIATWCTSSANPH